MHIITTAGIILSQEKTDVFISYLFPNVFDAGEAKAAFQRWNAWAKTTDAQAGYRIALEIRRLLAAGQPISPEIDAEIDRLGPAMPCPYTEVLCDQNGPVEILPGGLFAIGNDGTTYQQGKAGQWTKTPRL